MYTNFKDLHKAYGFDNPYICREDLEIDREREFVKDCYDTYEYLGFANTFGTPYSGEKKYVGMKFTVLGRVNEFPQDKNGADLECLPMWNIRFENGDEMVAYPEEICLAERNNKF